MRKQLEIITTAILWGGIGLIAKGAELDSLQNKLAGMKTFNAAVEVMVSLPMGADDEVKYEIDVASLPTATIDTLSEVTYLIDWTLPSASSNSHGFSAYFPGNFYRFRDGGGRLQEYHFQITPDPFTSFTPVQKTAQFMETLPVTIASEIAMMRNDTTFLIKYYPDTLYKGNPAEVLRGTRIINGLEALNFIYVFDASDSRPVYIEKEMSPGTISEQTVYYRYSYPDEAKRQVPETEQVLIELYPEAFAQFREGTYALASLKGKPLPGFSLPTLEGERYSYNRGDELTSPLLIVFVDEKVGSTASLMTDVRETLTNLPMNVDVDWVFLSNRHDDIADVTGKLLPGERVLISGRNVVQDFGITETPSLIFVDTQGIVTDVLAGYNKSVSDIITAAFVGSLSR